MILIIYTYSVTKCLQKQHHIIWMASDCEKLQKDYFLYFTVEKSFQNYNSKRLKSGGQKP